MSHVYELFVSDCIKILDDDIPSYVTINNLYIEFKQWYYKSYNFHTSYDRTAFKYGISNILGDPVHSRWDHIKII